MSRPPLDSTHIGTNTTNKNISHFDSTPVGTKISDPKSLTLPMESSKLTEKTQKEYVSEDPEADLLPSDSLSSEYNLSDNNKYIISKRK